MMNHTILLKLRIRNNSQYTNHSSHISHYSTRTSLFSSPLFIDKGQWKVIIFPRHNLDIGINELYNKMVDNKNYALFIQGSYKLQYISIGPKILINKNTSREFIKEYYKYYLGLLSENYEVDLINELIFRFKDTEILKINQPVLPKDLPIKPIIPKSFLHEKMFPASASNDNFGELISTSINDKGQEVYEFEYDKFNIFRTKVSESKYFNEVYLNGNRFTSFEDVIFMDGKELGEPYFVRIINDRYKLYYSLKNKTILKQEVTLKPNFMKKINLSFNESNNFITFDIEAYLNTNNEFVPYACGWYDGSNARMYYLTDYESSLKMIAAAFEDIFEYINSGKNHDKKFAIYVHNLAHYDGVYIIEALQTLGSVKPLMKDNKIIYIDAAKDCDYLGKGAAHKKRKIKIRLLDSYSLIPVNLKDLAKEFNCQTQKGSFPHSFVKEHNLNYVGAVPPFSYYERVDSSEYIEMIKNFENNWSLRNEALKYLKNDIISLYEVLICFAKEIFNEYNVNITNYPTISSLAMGIYRGHFLKDESSIPLLKGEAHNFIRKSYFGGATEVYKPKLAAGYYYDVNSLYPAAMMRAMPIGQPIISNEQNLDKIFGFCLVKVIAPKDLKTPILPFRDEQGKTLFPVGEWVGVYFSEEIKEARKFGYKFTIYQSYIFEKGDIFSDFVNKLYEKKSNSIGAERQIAKLLLNSLYGRMGLKEIADETVLVKADESDKIYSMFEIKEVLPLNNGFELIRYNKKPDLSKIQVPEVLKEAARISYNLDQSPIESNSSIAIASAITAYARIHMNQYKFISGNPMFATDTDSGHFEHPLPDEMVGPEIGKMKLEHRFTNAYYIAPKLYGFIKEDGEPKVVAKGVGPELNYSDIVALYEAGAPIKVKKDIWIKDLSEYKIKVVSREIEIKGELTKREKVFNASGQWIDTRPLVVKDGVVISEIKAPKALEGEIIITKDLKAAEVSRIDINSNKTSVGAISKVEALLVELNKLDKVIESDKEAIKNSSGILKTVFSTQLMAHTDDRSTLLAELRNLGVVDPYSWVNPFENSAVIKEAEFEECIQVKCLPAPAKLLALPAPIDSVISTNADEPLGANTNVPEIIYLPAPLPKVIPLSAPSKENLIIELNSKIKELNEEISKINAKIENINALIQSILSDRSINTDELLSNDTKNKVLKINNIQELDNSMNEEQQKYLPAPAKFLALAEPKGSGTSPIGDGAGKADRNVPEIIELPAPLPNIIYLPGIIVKSSQIDETSSEWSIPAIENWLIDTKKEIDQINDKKLILEIITGLYNQKIEMENNFKKLSIDGKDVQYLEYIKILVKLYLFVIIKWTTSNLENETFIKGIISKEGWIDELRMFVMSINDDKWYLYELKIKNNSAYEQEKAYSEPVIYLIEECVYQILHFNLVSKDEVYERRKENEAFWGDSFVGIDEKNKLLNPRLIKIMTNYFENYKNKKKKSRK
jgi:hypothetical protein